ncbi:hypothetical protein [Micromonospora arborensis]|uniref:hypothetical protein n=1 Tax=Micromonospora arborensis TaxID=2116518 RepID=UPI0037151E4B
MGAIAPSNLSDVFVRDLNAGRTAEVSATVTGATGNGDTAEAHRTQPDHLVTDILSSGPLSWETLRPAQE